MREIPLTQGKIAFVDDEDYNRLSKFKWRFKKDRNGGYAAHSGPRMPGRNQTTVNMAREILNVLPGVQVDHINRNKLDNQKRNLRIVTHAENTWNTGARTNNKLGAKGVVYRNGKYEAALSFRGKQLYLGRFESLGEAEEAYRQKAVQLRGSAFVC